MTVLRFSAHPVIRRSRRWLARQEGMFSTEQLLAAGLGRGGISLRLRRGWLHPLHHQVYAVGHSRVTAKARLWAAILACGGPEPAVLIHRSAAAMSELIRTPSGRVEVTTLRQSHSAEAIRVDRARSLEAQNITSLDGLPLTTPTRTLIDLADQLAPQRVPRAMHFAPRSCAGSTRPPSTPDWPPYPAAVPAPCTTPSRPWTTARNPPAAHCRNACSR
jgi:hypothetical protein